MQAGPVAFPRLKTGDAIEAWCKEVVQGCGVLLLPASVYDHQASTVHGHFRIGLGRKDMPECLKVLDAWCVSKYGDPDAAPAQ
jgi:aspartate/methionine/tyrosine aminotransferase